MGKYKGHSTSFTAVLKLNDKSHFQGTREIAVLKKLSMGMQESMLVFLEVIQ